MSRCLPTPFDARESGARQGGARARGLTLGMGSWQMGGRSNRESLDTWRGFACLLLVVYHVIGSDPTHGLRVAEGPLRLLNDGLAYLRMPLFTFLSGMVYGLRPFAGDSRAFLGGKARRLLVPMLFVGTLFAVVRSLVPVANHGAGHDRNWLLLHIEPVAHFWFLEALFWIFVVIWALERGRLLATPARLVAFWLLAATVDLTTPGPYWLALGGATYLLPYFLAGLAVSRFSLAPQLGRGWMRALLVAAAGFAIVKLGMPVPDADRHTLWVLVAGMSLCALCAGLRFEVRWLARIGTSSYAIYLFHVFFTAAARMALQNVGVTASALLIVAGVVLGIGGPMLVERWASRHAGTRVLMLGQPLRRRETSPPTRQALAPLG
jgi:peptidoglycan/LPS O-acetylase OafA/YrhL